MRSLFYSQARAAQALLERELKGAEMEINTERLATLMAAFENGEVFHASNPFDVDDPLAFADSHACRMVNAFAALAKSDTPFVRPIGPDPDDPTPTGEQLEIAYDDHQTALVAAGLLQGMWIGFEYAHREVYGEEGA